MAFRIARITNLDPLPFAILPKSYLVIFIIGLHDGPNQLA